MFELKNLSKKFITKKKETIDALKDISLVLPDKGFYGFIGKSGSGKSTFLNILGGLDRHDSGKLIINGQNVNGFTDKEWDAYRAKNIGFIFQESYLVDELTVEENIALSLEIMDHTPDEIKPKVDRVLDELDLKGYGNRKVYELSGGEKQRVVIGRAIIKNPSIILADEPTGSLDEETGQVILKILKKLAKDKLVIMVSHDLENTKKYADAVYELSNGELVSQNINNTIDDKHQTQNQLQQCKLPNQYILKQAIKNLFYNKTKFILMNFLLIFSLIFLFLTISLFKFNFGEVSYHSLIENNINVINVTYENTDCDACLQENQQMLDDIAQLKTKYSNTSIYEVNHQEIFLNNFQGENQAHLQNPTYFDKTKIERIVIYDTINSNRFLHGKESKASDEIVITDYVAYMLLRFNLFSIQSIDQLIGKEITFSMNVQLNTYQFKISGILDTDYEKYLNITSNAPKEEKDNFELNHLYHYGTLYFTSDNLDYIKNNTTYLSMDYATTNLIPFNLNARASILNDENKLYGEKPNQENEIIIPLSYLLQVEGMTFQTFQRDEMNHINQWLNKNLPLTSTDVKVLPTLNSGYTIVGIYNNMEDEDNLNVINTLFVTDDYYEKHYTYQHDVKTKEAKVYISSNNPALISFLNDIDRNNYQHVSPVSDGLYSIYDDITKFQSIIFLATLFIIILVGLLFYTFISNMIKDKKTQIGLLRSLGLTGKDCSKVFLTEILMVIIIVNILTFVLLSFIFKLINTAIQYVYQFDFKLFYFNQTNILYTLILSIFISLIASYLPLSRITRMKPIEALKG